MGKCGARLALTPVQRSTYGITGQTRRTHKFSPLWGGGKHCKHQGKARSGTYRHTHAYWLWGRETESGRDVCRGRNSRVRSKDGHGVRGKERNMERNIDGFRSKGSSKDRSVVVQGLSV